MDPRRMGWAGQTNSTVSSPHLQAYIRCWSPRMTRTHLSWVHQLKGVLMHTERGARPPSAAAMRNISQTKRANNFGPVSEQHTT